MADNTVYSDFLVDDNGAFIIENGTFKTGPSLQKESKTIINRHQGDCKEFPLIGCNLSDNFSAPFTLKGRNSLAGRIRKQHEMDGIKVFQLDIKSFRDIKLSIKRA
jgi:hypothetical protein